MESMMTEPSAARIDHIWATLHRALGAPVFFTHIFCDLYSRLTLLDIPSQMKDACYGENRMEISCPYPEAWDINVDMMTFESLSENVLYFLGFKQGSVCSDMSYSGSTYTKHLWHNSKIKIQFNDYLQNSVDVTESLKIQGGGRWNWE